MKNQQIVNNCCENLDGDIFYRRCRPCNAPLGFECTVLMDINVKYFNWTTNTNQNAVIDNQQIRIPLQKHTLCNTENSTIAKIIDAQ